ncbi:alpha/beta hydrolase [Aquimonas sp.]|jgi:pimeloyl-ACP methyl ester carboxylesterase|uniref:alpha/beta hydrolase n=1 Tax=Aquimonas sp. TaxID=1872588 RepID=UPI0037BFFC56
MQRLLICIAASAGLALAAPAEAQRRLGTLNFEPCVLSAPLSVLNVEAQCTRFEVPENPAEPAGRKIELAIAWVPTENSAGADDPLFMIAGGPGQSALESYPGLHGAFREIRKNRHVILVDQRGTGDSNRLVCKDAEGDSALMETESDIDPAQWRQFAERCRDELKDSADLRYYSTTEAIADLDAVRQAIGVQQINLLGVSYGTRVAQQYMRRYPQHTRSVVLDSVVPNTLALGSEHARNLEDALDLHFGQCTDSATCNERFGSPRESLNALLAELRANPRPVRFRDPVSGEELEKDLTVGHVATVARMYSYAPAVAAMLPLSLHEAAQGRASALMAQAEMITGSLSEQIMHGMQLSVICTEDAHRMRPDPIDATRLLGEMMVKFTLEQCAVWPKGTAPADFNAPVESAIPTLLLSGEFDPVTPPRYGDEVAKTLSNSRHLILRGQGHSLAAVGCMPRLLGEFIETNKPAELKAECLDTLKPNPPFAGFYGWEP